MSVNEKMTDIADAIRLKTGGTDPLTLDAMASEIAGIEAGGGENPLDYATGLRYMFYGATYSEPADIDISFGNKVTCAANTDGLAYVLMRCVKIKSIKISWGGIASSVSMNCFAEHNNPDTMLEKVDLSGALDALSPTNMTKAFYYRTALREILGEFDMTKAYNLSATFLRCDALETIRVKAGTVNKTISFTDSSKLTDESIQSIIDGLADLTGGTAQTLTLHATVGAKLTDGQIAAATAKNWTLSY